MHSGPNAGILRPLNEVPTRETYAHRQDWQTELVNLSIERDRSDDAKICIRAR